MNKYLKIAMIGLVLIAVFVSASLVTGKKQVEVISTSDFNKLIEKDTYIYYGEKDKEKELQDIAKDNKLQIKLYPSTNKNEDLKECTFYKYENGKVVFDYKGELKSYKLTEALMEKGYIDRTYITVSLEDYKNIIKEDGYHFMFIGSEQCGYCTKFKTSVNKSLKDNNYKVYYIDIASLSETEYNDLVATDSYMSEKEWGTPLNLLYKDGKRVAELNGYVSTDELVKFLKENKVI